MGQDMEWATLEGFTKVQLALADSVRPNFKLEWSLQMNLATTSQVSTV
jgi:hypothetical protein